MDNVDKSWCCSVIRAVVAVDKSVDNAADSRAVFVYCSVLIQMLINFVLIIYYNVFYFFILLTVACCHGVSVSRIVFS